MRSTCGLIIVLSLVAGASSAVERATDDRRLLPTDGVGGWRHSAPARIYTEADLYGYIDGGAEVFLELGFEQLTLQRYEKAGREFSAEIYRMKDATAARGIYLAKCGGRETPGAGFTERHTIGRYQLMFQRERYFVVVNNASGSQEQVADLMLFARYIASKAPADQPVAALARLPQPGLVPGSMRIIRGPFTLQAIYTLGDGDILSLGGRITAVAGEYTSPAVGRHTLIQVIYPTPERAAQALTHLRTHLDRYLKPTSQTASRLAFSDYEQKFGIVTVEGPKLTVRIHLLKPAQG